MYSVLEILSLVISTQHNILLHLENLKARQDIQGETMRGLYNVYSHLHRRMIRLERKDGSIGTGDESNFWSSSPRSDSPSPNGYIQVGPYQVYKPISYTAIDHRHVPYKTEYSHLPIPAEIDSTNHIPFVRVVKRRSTANKKERRRTQSINNAYADLRDCIPNVPADTKLSKIKTLRLATSYISYLTRALETDDTVGGFKAELGSISRKTTNNLVHVNGCPSEHVPPKTDLMEDLNNSRKAKGRTGWPQHVWALELKQEQTI